MAGNGTDYIIWSHLGPDPNRAQMGPSMSSLDMSGFARLATVAELCSAPAIDESLQDLEEPLQRCIRTQLRLAAPKW